MGVLLLAGGAGLGVRERSQKRIALDHNLTNKVDDDASRLEAYFDRARSIMLITAHNPAFQNFYLSASGARLAKVKAGGPAIRKSEAALVYLEQLYPKSIGEACFIDRTGPENARYVHGRRAALEDLSPDERGNPFFRPTFALRAGRGRQPLPAASRRAARPARRQALRLADRRRQRCRHDHARGASQRLPAHPAQP